MYNLLHLDLNPISHPTDFKTVISILPCISKYPRRCIQSKLWFKVSEGSWLYTLEVSWEANFWGSKIVVLKKTQFLSLWLNSVFYYKKLKVHIISIEKSTVVLLDMYYKSPVMSDRNSFVISEHSCSVSQYTEINANHKLRMRLHLKCIDRIANLT